MTPQRALAAPTGLAVLAVALAAGLAACGGNEDETKTACAETPGSKKGPIVIVAEVEDSGEVLALADCTPLYTNDVDTEKRIRCTGECARVWIPVIVPKGGSITTQTPSPVGVVTIVDRPDGRRQAAINRKPLYAFSEESEQGASGDGVTDTFDGTEFTWSVLTPGEAAPEKTQPGTLGLPPGTQGPGQAPQGARPGTEAAGAP